MSALLAIGRWSTLQQPFPDKQPPAARKSSH
jgi:hypothetical protein